MSSPLNGRLRCVHYLECVRLEHGGVVRAVLDLAGALAARGHEVVLLTADAADVPESWRAGGAGVPQVVTGVVKHHLLRREFLNRAEVLLANADVLHLHGPWELGNLQLAARARRHGVAYVLTLHGMLDEWSMSQKALKKRVFLALLGKRFLARAARVHCTAASELSQAQKFLRPDSGAVVPCVVDLSDWRDLPGPELAFAQVPQLRRDQPRILFLGRLHPKKGVELLIEAAAKLARQPLRFQLVIAGPGEPDYLAHLQQLARANNIESHTIFPGMVRGPAKTALYQACDVFVLPTSQENFGLVLIEALASGTPVITTRGVDIWQELCEAGAVIVDAKPDVIATAIKPFLEGTEIDRATTGRHARDYVLSWLRPERVMADYEALYRDLTSAP